MAEGTEQQSRDRKEERRDRGSRDEPKGRARELEPVRERGRGMGLRSDPFSRIAPQDFFSASPFELMRRLSDEMNRAFEGFGFGGREGRSPFWSPSVELKERENELIARIDLPGLEPDDVTLDITEDGIVVRGERKREEQEEGEGWVRSELSYGQFMRLIPLPPGADAESASAQFEKGVLRIRVPIAESRGRRSIPIGTRAEGGAQEAYGTEAGRGTEGSGRSEGGRRSERRSDA